jgi:hypothetical protein
VRESSTKRAQEVHVRGGRCLFVVFVWWCSVCSHAQVHRPRYEPARTRLRTARAFWFEFCFSSTGCLHFFSFLFSCLCEDAIEGIGATCALSSPFYSLASQYSTIGTSQVSKRVFFFFFSFLSFNAHFLLLCLCRKQSEVKTYKKREKFQSNVTVAKVGIIANYFDKENDDQTVCLRTMKKKKKPTNLQIDTNACSNELGHQRTYRHHKGRGTFGRRVLA